MKVKDKILVVSFLALLIISVVLFYSNFRQGIISEEIYISKDLPTFWSVDYSDGTYETIKKDEFYGAVPLGYNQSHFWKTGKMVKYIMGDRE